MERGLFSELTDTDRAVRHASLRQRYQAEIDYYCETGTIDVRDRPLQGLGLDASLQQRIFHDNALVWYPALAEKA